MNSKLTKKEREYLALIKEMPCGVCDAPPPSEAHHITQHMHHLCMPLCVDCHRGGFNGIHGQKRMWLVQKKTEMSVLNETIRGLYENYSH